MKSTPTNTELYSLSKKEGVKAKTLLRNQMLYGTKMLEQTDEKANMLLSLSFSIAVILFVVIYEFGSFLHFPYWFLLLIIIGFVSTGVIILVAVRPNYRNLKKLITDEVLPSYPEHKDRSLIFNQCLTNEAMETASDLIVSSPQLQIGNMVRANYIMNRYVNTKYKFLDRAFYIFLGSMILMFFLFIYNFIASSGVYHDHTERKAKIYYDFETEDAVFNMPYDLVEISGLAYDFKDDCIYTHNDENGIVFKLDLKTMSVIDRIQIATDGDFEGVVVLEDHIVITTSSGTLYGYHKSSGAVEKINTQFKPSHDVEGLDLHPTEDKLLIACKGKKYFRSDADRGIYTYDYNSQEVADEPFLEIYYQDIRTFAEQSFEDDNKRHLVSRSLKSFAPSGIAVHPITQDIYLVSGRKSMLIVYDSEHAIKDVISLKSLLMPQPEGICFDSSGNLYISTEGDGGIGKIIRYNYKPELEQLNGE